MSLLSTINCKTTLRVIVMRAIYFTALCLLICQPCFAETKKGGLEALAPQGLKMNAIQAIGTHNSYKSHLPKAELAMIAQKSPEGARALDYGHPPLKDQLDHGMRQLEIDVVYDPKGGLYATPLLPKLSGVAFDNSQLKKPGFKALHIPDVDTRSNCVTLIICLMQVRDWSNKNPRHVPILITMNAKEDGASLPFGVVPLKFDEAAFKALDLEIRSVFAEDRLITPDQVRGSHKTLREGVLSGGWPSLEASRGKVFFLIDEPEAKIAIYMGKNKSLEGKAAFVNSHREEADHAAIFILNDPTAEFDRIQNTVKAGFIVRTRADEATEQARKNDYSRLNKALMSGAHYISTDYPTPRLDYSPYKASLPENVVARLNPVAQEAKATIK